MTRATIIFSLFSILLLNTFLFADSNREEVKFEKIKTIVESDNYNNTNDKLKAIDDILKDKDIWIWLVVGFAGQTLFGSRMIIQWIASEKNKKSVIPVSFWYLSISGSLLLLSYAIYRKDPVFIVSQSTGFFIYIRNIYFHNNTKLNGS